MLEPEPVINKPYVEFYSRAEAWPLLSLFMDKPNTDELNAFVVALQQRVLEASSGFSDFDVDSQPAGNAGNVFAELPEFEESDQKRVNYNGKSIDSVKIENAIQMLERYVADEEVRPLLSAMKALKEEPQNESCMEQVVSAFNDLGIVQGAVLTYAPYVSVLLMDDPYGDH